MEILFGSLTSALLAYVLSEIKLARREINQLENRVIKMEVSLPKRKEDHYEA